VHYFKIEGQIAAQAFDGVCHNYGTGHSPHLIQIRRALESQLILVNELRVFPKGCVSLSVGDSTIEVFNHHEKTIEDLSLMHPDAKFQYSESMGMLFLRLSEVEGFAFSVSSSPLGFCSS
jgi:hypothetical protein